MDEHDPQSTHVNRVVPQLHPGFKGRRAAPEIRQPMNRNSRDRRQDRANARDLYEVPEGLDRAAAGLKSLHYCEYGM